MRVLVTGSNGCVGSALRSICKDDINWIFIERKDCDLTDREKTINIINDIKPEYVVHLASYVPGFYNINKVDSFSKNIRINENVLEAVNKLGIEKSMFCLSVNMFSESVSTFPMDESMIFEGSLAGPFSGYALSKRMLEFQCQNYNQQYNRKYFGIIPCNIYGPNDNLQSGRLIPNIISKFKQAIEDESNVVINGSGKPVRQFIYSIDLAKIIKFLVFNYSDIKPVICCGDNEVNIAELAKQIAELTKYNKTILFDTSKPDGNMRKTVSNSYLKTIMPNVSFTPLSEGLKQTIILMDKI